MVVSAPQSQSQPQPQHLSAEEEALKRNTDCVYFLASPLTCKKGAECEYRHSEVTLVNPRDCYFWLHGNCLNPKCGFRHPPLDGLLGMKAPASIGPSAPVSQTAVASAPHAPNASTKPGVPCIFFQKGYCLKGDWCPFLHMPNSLSSKPSLVPVAATDLANHKKAVSGPPEKPFQQKTTPPANVPKSVNDPAVAKSSFPNNSASPRNESATTKRMASQTAGVTEVHVYRHSTPVSNGNPINWPITTQQSRHLDDPEPEFTISKDNDEISREPSPGFDVLVDDDLRDSDYYPSDDRYGLARDHEAQNEYDIGLPNDYSTIGGVDGERYQGHPVSYDSPDHRRGQYSYEDHRAPSERRRLGGSHVERGLYGRNDPFDQVEEQDLRHRLAKHKKPNGLRSVISHENPRRDMDQGHRGPRREDQQENTISSRLRGRIGPPRMPAYPNNKNHGRSSPIRTNTSDVRGRVDEGFRNTERNYKGPFARQDRVGEDFAGPKSLSELKNRKNVEIGGKSRIDQQSLGKRKHMHHGSESDMSFEGPKPLEEILKRKRGGSNRVAPNNDQGPEKGSDIQEERKDVTANNEFYESNTETQKGETEDGKTSAPKAEEDGTLDDGGDQEFEDEGYDEGEGDYERAGVEDYNLYEGDNGEYGDEDDDSDFAKKMGVMYS